MKFDQSAIREQCRFSCGAAIIIEHMLPYLLPSTAAVDEEDDTSASDDSSSDTESDDDGSESELD